jgi:hypothetical protein
MAEEEEVVVVVVVVVVVEMVEIVVEEEVEEKKKEEEKKATSRLPEASVVVVATRLQSLWWPWSRQQGQSLSPRARRLGSRRILLATRRDHLLTHRWAGREAKIATR